MIYILITIGALSVFFGVLSGYFATKDKSQLRLITKMTGSLIFIMLAIIAFYDKAEFSNYFILVIIALIFGMLGDVFLCLYKFVDKQHSLILNIIGATCFFIGHIFFVIIFLTKEPLNLYLIPTIFILPVALLVTARLKIIKVGKLLIPCMVYALFLNLMMTSAVNVFISHQDTAGALILTAGILFATSDICLSIRDFGKLPKQKVNVLIYVVLSTYYIAQVLFALSVYFIN